MHTFGGTDDASGVPSRPSFSSPRNPDSFRTPIRWFLFLLTALAFACTATAQVVINEIQYHPVELPHFDSTGNPTYSDTSLPADLSEDIHEFIELRNAGSTSISLSGWKLIGGIDFTFPQTTTLSAGGFLVVAKNPSRIESVYDITGVLGPFTGTLANKGDTVRLTDTTGNTVDSVKYQSSFPWPNSPDALGAADDFTLLDSATYQYKGRSLERVSATHPSNDPANWLASPLGSSPSPGSPNAVTLPQPKPIVIGFSAVQSSDDAAVIRANQSVRVNCRFSSTTDLGTVQLESFVDAIDGPTAYTEPRTTLAMTDLGQGQFTAVLPGQPDRTIVRWRIRVDHGSGFKQVFPRPDDAAIVPVGAAVREAWKSYFVSPARNSTNPSYDIFVSNSDQTSGAFNGLNGLAAMNYNISGNPKRVTSAASSGLPRDLPYVPASARLWNGSVPAIFVVDGEVRDAHLRYHGSRYNRNAGRNSFKLRFPDTQKFRGSDSVFVTDKSDYFSVGQGLYLYANLPISEVRWVDWYLNNNGLMLRLEQGEYNGDLLDPYHRRMADLNPGTPKEATGELYKDVGTIEATGEGPYDNGSGRKLIAAGPWSSLQRYEWTYTLQNNGWKGAKPIKDFFDGLWAARGDTSTSPKPNLPNLRAYLDTQLDTDSLLTSLSIATWMCPWDDTTQNHFLWRRANGRWNHILWDFDGMFGNGDTTGMNSWIYLGENGSPPAGILGNNFRGPNWFKDSVYKAYREEYKYRLWLMNNTYLHPDNLKTLFYRNSGGSLTSFYSFINAVKPGFCEGRFASINTQTGHAANGSDFLRPLKPTLIAPLGGGTALPPLALTASDYTHSSGIISGTNAHAKSKWEIRVSTGDYFRPTFAITSTNHLTTFPIPFSELTFGLTYFWRVTYFDANDHPSVTSDEASFAFGPQSSTQTLIAFNSAWKYDFAGNFTNESWAQPGFIDSAWSTGTGTLAFENPGSIPESIGTTLPDPRTLTPANRAFYFRKHFNVPANPATLSNLHIRHVIDDGCVIWINGVRIHRYFMNDQATYTYDSFSNGGPGDGVYQVADSISNTTTWSWIDPRPYLVQGDNVIAVEVHQVNNSSSDITMGLELTATLSSATGDVVINEVLATGSNGNDWIELKNTSNDSKDLSGFGLTDDILNPTRFVFPKGTTLPANGFLTLLCSSSLPASSTNTGFGLDSGGQRIVLTSNGNIRDFVAFGPQARNYTIGRVPDGSGAFTLTTPTFNTTNREVATLGTVSNLRINEWMANPAHGDDWFELYNTDANPVSLGGLYLSDNPAKPQITQIQPLSFIAGHDATLFQADGSNAGGNHANFKLSSSGDKLLLNSGSTTIDAVDITGVLLNTSQGRLPDGSSTLRYFPISASPGESNWSPSPVVINEALTRSTPPEVDAIELFNPTGLEVDLSGWWISDDQRTRQKFQIPVGTKIPARGFRVFTETQWSSGAVPFQLSHGGDEIVLSATSNGAETGLRSQVSFGRAADGVTFGRVLTGSPVGSWKPEFWPQTSRTLGSPNSGPSIGPVVINELHYHPPDLAAGKDNTADEFVELYNPASSPVDLGGWKLKGAADFAFTAGTSVSAGEYLLIVGFDPVVSPNLLAAFRAIFSVPAGTRILGPFSPKLPNDGGSIELARPDPTLPIFFNVDQVQYADFSQWPTSPDGTGMSLQRANVSMIGNDPANWAGLAPTPGKRNPNQPAVLDTDGDGLPNAWEDTYGFDKNNPADALLDADGDGFSNLAEFIAGTDPRNAADLLSATAREVDGGIQIQFTAQSGKTYTIQYQTKPGEWLRLIDVPAPVSTKPITAEDRSPDPLRFYRIVTPRIP